MKQMITLAIFLWCVASLHAQAWQPFGQGESHHFHSDTAAFPFRTLSVDSVRNTPAGQTWYFNRLIHVVAMDTVNVDWPNFAQRRMVDLGGGHYHFIDPGNISIHALADSGDTWVIDSVSGLQATVRRVFAGSVLGEADSIKVVAVGGTDSLILSRDHGIIEWPTVLGGEHFVLAGLQDRGLGDTLPGFDGLFAQKPGDIYYWEGNYAEFDLGSGDYYHYRWKMQIDSVLRDSNGLLLHYSALIRSEVQPYNSVSAYTFHGTWMLKDTVHALATKGHAASCPGKRLLSHYQLISFTFPMGFHDGYYPMMDSWYMGVRWSMEGNRKVLTLDPIAYYPHYIWEVYSFPYAIQENRGRIQELKFVEGIGLTHTYFTDFERFGGVDLVGSIVDGDTVGTIWTDSVLLHTGQAASLPWQLYPNPAHHSVNITLPIAGTVQFIDLTGRILETHSLEAGTTTVSLANFPRGCFLVRVECEGMRRSQRLVVSR